MLFRSILILVICILIKGCGRDEAPTGKLELLNAFVGTTAIARDGSVSEDLPVDQNITLTFSKPVDEQSHVGSVILLNDGQIVECSVTFSAGGTAMTLYPTGLLNTNTVYSIRISQNLRGAAGESFVPVELRFKTFVGDLKIVTSTIGGEDANGSGRLTDVPRNLTITLMMSAPVDETSIEDAVSIAPGPVFIDYSVSADGKTITFTGEAQLSHLSKYEFKITEDLRGSGGEQFAGYSRTFYTAVDETPKFPLLSDEDLLTKVQQQTFKYFWEFAEPSSGMARERNTSGNLVTSGGSGFGIMAIIVGIERGFITRAEGLDRMDRILDFLETADRFHGAWSHWIDGTTGNVIPFSANDNGGDLVETSFLIQGLLTFRQYLDAGNPSESTLINRINDLWESVEWDWYTRGEAVLYWHWSPDKNWIMNHQIRGYNECLITYVLSASSETHAIDATVYHNGWAQNGSIENGGSFYNINLPLGSDYGGPLFFSHYSFLGLDPRNLVDGYADYWMQNVNHTLINRAYCVANPQGFVAYGESCWGLTASDNHQGYAAHSPTWDLGVITPTAALSSFPYTPDESIEALKFFYYTMGDRLWGEYGFHDSFNVTEGWYADSWLAIDQGPIIVMIENHRTGLLWDLFMSCPEVQAGLTKLGFTY